MNKSVIWSIWRHLIRSRVVINRIFCRFSFMTAQYALSYHLIKVHFPCCQSSGNSKFTLKSWTCWARPPHPSQKFGKPHRIMMSSFFVRKVAPPCTCLYFFSFWHNHCFFKTLKETFVLDLATSFDYTGFYVKCSLFIFNELFSCLSIFFSSLYQFLSGCQYILSPDYQWAKVLLLWTVWPYSYRYPSKPNVEGSRFFSFPM